MSFCNLVQPPRVGPKITNCLGFIRKDLAVSYIDAVEVQEETADCCCPVLKTYCLKLPCDLVDPGCQCVTTPLINGKTGEPFVIKKGCLLDCIIIAKCEGVCIDQNLTFILGALTADGDQEKCNRWVAESNCVCGDFLNCACFIKIDASAKCRNVGLELCASDSCGTGCGSNNGLCGVGDDCSPGDCIDFKSNGGCQETGDHYGTQATQCGPCGRCLNCCKGLEGCTNGTVCKDPCFKGFKGPCPLLRFGELENALLGITVCKGTLFQSDLTFTVQCWELSGDKCCQFNCDECTGPRFLF